MTAEETSLQLKCDQCNYTNATEKGLRQHWRMRHRISQVDGSDEVEEESEAPSKKLSSKTNETTSLTAPCPTEMKQTA